MTVDYLRDLAPLPDALGDDLLPRPHHISSAAPLENGLWLPSEKAVAATAEAHIGACAIGPFFMLSEWLRLAFSGKKGRGEVVGVFDVLWNIRVFFLLHFFPKFGSWGDDPFCEESAKYPQVAAGRWARARQSLCGH